MGSFNVQCSVTGMNIQDGEPMYVMRLEKTGPVNLDDSHFYIDDWYTPTSFPQLTKYDDYGRFENFETSPLNKKVDVILRNDLQKPKHWMGIHKLVYEAMSTGFLGSGPPIYRGTMRDIVDQGSQFFLDKFKPIIESMKEDIENGTNEITEGSKIPKRYLHSHRFATDMDLSSRRNNLYDAIGLHLMVEDDYSILDSTLADEMVKMAYFNYNFDSISGRFKPANYAGQEDTNIEFEGICKLMLEVSQQKRKRWEDE